jgi:hypothetical protein
MPKIDYPHLLCRIQPGLVSFAVMMVGFMILALSFFWGVGQQPVQLGKETGEVFVKEVGYGSALNWSLTLTLVLPAALLYLCKVYQSFPSVLRELVVNRMVVTEEMAPISEKELKDLWRQKLTRYSRWLALLMLVGLLFSLWEWYDYSVYPLWQNSTAQAPEWDWSVGALFDSSGRIVQAGGIERVQNAMISLLAFLGQSVIIAAVLTFVYKALIVGVFFTDISMPEGRYRLVPNPKSDDKRLGFELFSEFIERSLICIGVFYGIFYLSRLQNIYLRTSEESMLGFLVDRLLLGLLNNPFDLGGETEVFRKGLSVEKDFDFSSIMVSLGAFAVLMIAVYMIGATVRDAAVRARSELKNNLQVEPKRVERLFGLGPKEIEARLKGMVFWPVRYIRAREFFGLVILGVSCIFFYKLGLILIGLLLFRVFVDVAKYILGLVKEEPASAS